MQARFGDAGRGLMMPGFPFPYYKAPGFDFEKIGEWTAANSLTDEGILWDFRRQPDLGVPRCDAGFDQHRGAFRLRRGDVAAKPPATGDAVISAGEMHEEISTAGEQQSVLRVPLDGKASSVKIETKGDGPITVLGWSVSSGRAGRPLRQSRHPRRLGVDHKPFRPGPCRERHQGRLSPKLVVLGYGTNEGFIDSLDLDAYAKGYERLIALVKDAAPDASLVILGPLDGARLPRFVKAPDKAELPCRALSDDERANYDALVAAKDAKIAHWYTPPKLDDVRQTLKKIAERHDALYWDMSTVMGGPCSIESWVKAKPPLALADHVHLSDEGSRRVGRALYAALIADYDRHGRQADSSGVSAPEDGAASPRVAGR